MARKGENADSMVAAVAPAVARRNSRRLHEIARSMLCESPTREGVEKFARLQSLSL
jgi:hypothetical protein